MTHKVRGLVMHDCPWCGLRAPGNYCVPCSRPKRQHNLRGPAFAVWAILWMTAGGLLRMLIGCAPEPVAPTPCAPMPDIGAAFTQLLEEAEGELGPIPGDCIEQVHAVNIVGHMHDMPEVCWRDALVVGCNAIDQNGYPHIWLVECQRDPLKTARAERLHTLLHCVDVDDPNHERPIWATLELLP